MLKCLNLCVPFIKLRNVPLVVFCLFLCVSELIGYKIHVLMLCTIVHKFPLVLNKMHLNAYSQSVSSHIRFSSKFNH